MAVRLRHCCCGCSLKEGAIVIGVFFVILSITTTIGGIFFGVEFGLQYTSDSTLWNLHPAVTLPILVVELVFAVVDLVTSSLLLRGIVKYDRRLVIPWLLTNAVLCGLLFLAVVGGAIACFIVTATHIDGDLTTVTYGFIILVPGAFLVGVYVYFLLVVYSFYCLLPMLSSERIAVLLDRFKNPYFQQEDESDHTPTPEVWSNATATPRFSGY
ncbi:uncharacterized protein [Periplaneta americana]|uniref:uncharacterized protein n=1 Tax=Periplaneta americana TaxID=6978 RepID=UPI0037E985BD